MLKENRTWSRKLRNTSRQKTSALSPKVDTHFHFYFQLIFSETNAKVAAKKKTGGEEEEPAATIYVENLPDEANESMLNLLFSQFPGFKKSRPIPAGGKGNDSHQLKL